MTTLEPKQLVLAKIKGFPDWPAIIVPLDKIPDKLKTPKFSKFLIDYLQNNNDHVCVKFYYDDQYSWTTKSNIKNLNLQIVDDYLFSVGELSIDNNDNNNIELNSSKRGGRKKRITEAYLKVKEIPIDEFLEWGSWGKPIIPDIEIDDNNEINNETDNKKKRKLTNSNKSNKKKIKTSTSKKSKSKSKKSIDSSTPDSIDENLILIDDDENDKDFVENSTNEKNNKQKKKSNDNNTEIKESEESDESDDEIIENWGLDVSKAQGLNINFKEIPSANALSNEVTEMTNWCNNLKLELQNLIFPLKKQLNGNIEIKLEDQNNNNVDNKEQEIKTTDSLEKPIDYKKINKSIDSLILPLLNADLSKSILKTTGLSKIISIILKKPEFQSANVKKLNQWWYDNFNFKINVDIHWSDDYTIQMHLQEEKDRKFREEEKKRKRREEKKSQSLAATPEVEVPVTK